MRRQLTPLMLVLSALLVGCSMSGHGHQQQSAADETADLKRQILALTTEKTECAQRLAANEDELAKSRNRTQILEDQLRRALASPGYEASLRLVYQSLEQGDTQLLKQLLPSDQPVEAGFTRRQNSTFREYKNAADIDLQPFVDYARKHPLSSAQIAVTSAQPGFAVVSASYPDGTKFGLFFTGWMVTKIEVIAEPLLGGGA